MTPQLGDRTSGELAGIAATVLVPVGSTEQHGGHLPLDTDTRIAAAVAAAAADELNSLAAPPIAYGASGEHQGFAGTVSIGTAALQTVLVEYGRSALHWASRVVFVNGHGGNVDALRGAVGLLRREGRDTAWCTVTATNGADAHAGHTETSVLLHLSPELVCDSEIRPGNTEPLAQLMGRLRSGGVRSVSQSGVLGDPTTATAPEGARILATMVSDCAARVRRWRPQGDGMLM